MSTVRLRVLDTPKGHLELVCGTNFHMPDFTFAFLSA